MGMTFENLTYEQLCDLMCGKPEEEEGCQYTKQSQVVTNGARAERHTMGKALKRKQQNRAEQ